MWLLLALAGVLLWRRRSLFPSVGLAVVSADLITLALKVATDRPRPYVDSPEPPPLVTPALDLSFPSGHAATSFAAAAVLAAHERAAAIGAVALAAAIAASRVYAGVHYPLDVAAGAALGLAVGWAIVSLERRVMPRPSDLADPAR